MSILKDWMPKVAALAAIMMIVCATIFGPIFGDYAKGAYFVGLAVINSMIALVSAR